MKERTSAQEKIYSSNGSVIDEVVIGSSSMRVFKLMEEDYVRLDFVKNTSTYYPIGAYIVDPIFGKFVIAEEQMPKYQESSDSYKYELKFVSEYMVWKNRVFMLTYVLTSTNTRIRKEATWSLTAKLSEHLDELINNIDVLKGSGHGYTYDVSRCEKKAEVHTISYNGTNIIEALGMLADEWECEWWITGKTIHMGKCESQDEALTISLDNGSVEQMDIQNNRNTYANKLYVYGSTKNMPFSYRKKLYINITGSFYNVGTKYYKVDKAITTDMVVLQNSINFEAPEKLFFGGTEYAIKYTRYGNVFLSSAGTYNIKSTKSMSLSDVIMQIPFTKVGTGTRSMSLLVQMYLEEFNPARDQFEIKVLLFENTIQYAEFNNYMVCADKTELNVIPSATTTLIEGRKYRIAFKTQVTSSNISADSFSFDLNGYEYMIAELDTSQRFSYTCYKNGQPVIIEFLNAVKGSILYSTIYSDEELSVGDVIEVPTKSPKVPSAYYSTQYEDPSSLLTIGDNRLRMPQSTGDSLMQDDVDEGDAVEKVVIFDNIYPDGKLYAQTITAEEKKDYTEYDGETEKSDWQWHEYTITPYIKSSGMPFEFSKEFLLPTTTDLQIRFLTPDDVGDTNPGDGYKLAGMTFIVQFNASSKTFTIVRNSDFGALLPNDILKPTEGDPFVLIGWNVYAMEELGLIEDAEQRLLAKGQEYLEALEESQFTFDCRMRSDWMFRIMKRIPIITKDNKMIIDDDGKKIYVKDNMKYYTIPVEGKKVIISHGALKNNGTKQSRIIGYELKLDKPYDCPKYTIGETEAYSRLAKIEKEITTTSK